MVDSAGFEPATARFVAEYSIQLSYESRMVVLDQVTTGFNKAAWLARQLHYMVDSAGFEPATARFVAEYSIQLSYESMSRIIVRYFSFATTFSFNFNDLAIKPVYSALHLNNGGEGGIRTPDTLVRYTPLAGERLRPLGHLSATRGV